MNELDLLEQVVEELEAVEQEEKRDMDEFRERYDLLVDCAIDELNDEILKNKLNDGKIGGRFLLVKEGNHEVYRNDLLTAAVFIGGEEFTLKRVERGSSKSSLINFVFEPLESATYSYLVLSYDKAMSYMDKPFGKMIAHYLLPAMDSIEKDVVSLQHEFSERHRQREIKLAGDQTETYKASAWN